MKFLKFEFENEAEWLTVKNSTFMKVGFNSRSNGGTRDRSHLLCIRNEEGECA
jgi:hypothetical protein